MKLFSIENIPGCDYEALGLVKGEVVQSKHLGRDFMAGMKTIVGGEIKGYTYGFYDSYAALILIGAISPFNMIIIKNFFQELPLA